MTHAAANHDAQPFGLFDRPFTRAKNDDSGTPFGLIESARRTGRLRLLDRVDEDDVVVEFPFGSLAQSQTQCVRFVALRSGGYALIRPTAG